MLGCGEAVLCENTSPVEIPSPDGQRGAWVFIRRCGPTTASSVQVTILPAGSTAPNEAGNVFAIEPVIAVSVKWPSDRELLISRAAGGTVSKQEPRVSDVTISYRLE